MAEQRCRPVVEDELAGNVSDVLHKSEFPPATDTSWRVGDLLVGVVLLERDLLPVIEQPGEAVANSLADCQGLEDDLLVEIQPAHTADKGFSRETVLAGN